MGEQPAATEVDSDTDGSLKKVVCNGETQRTLELAGSGAEAVKSGAKISPELAGDDLSDSLDTRWRREGDKAVSLDSNDPPHNGHKSESSSSGDDEGNEDQEGDFAANWYMPLPQDPQPSDEEEDEEGTTEEGGSVSWSKGLSELSLAREKEEKLDDPSGMSAAASAAEFKPSSTMEDSEYFTFHVVW